MPKFYFHIHDGRDLLDTDGTDLADAVTVQIEALRLAGSVLRDEADRVAQRGAWSLLVSDAKGCLVYQIDLRTTDDFTNFVRRRKPKQMVNFTLIDNRPIEKTNV